MDCFDTCPLLKRLNLENNCISRLEGLHNCQQLQELYLGAQRIKRRVFTFDEYSLAAISGTLTILDLPQVNLVHSKPLYFLENVTTLNLEGNLIEDFDEQVAPILMTL